MFKGGKSGEYKIKPVLFTFMLDVLEVKEHYSKKKVFSIIL